MVRRFDVAVLGAGVAGSSLAKSLADRGWETVLIDRKHFPRHKVCGEFLSPESRTMLKTFGLQEAVESLNPSLIERSRLILSKGAELEVPLPGIAFGVSRYSLDSALHGSAIGSGVQMLPATTVTNVYPDHGGYTIEAKQGEERKDLRVRAVIAAWGANGHPVLSRHRPNPDRTYIGVKSHFRGLEMEPVVELYFFDGGYLGISPIEGGIFNVAALLRRKAFRNAEKTIEGLLDAACGRNPRLYRKLVHAVPVQGTQAAVAPVDLTRKPVTWSSIPHVGDAVVMIPPLCGDGMSMALRSALLCAPLADRYLSGRLSLHDWQREYSKSVRREWKGPLAWGRLVQRLFDFPVLPRLFLGAARWAPGLANGLVNATRLKEADL